MGGQRTQNGCRTRTHGKTNIYEYVVQHARRKLERPAIPCITECGEDHPQKAGGDPARLNDDWKQMVRNFWTPSSHGLVRTSIQIPKAMKIPAATAAVNKLKNMPATGFPVLSCNSYFFNMATALRYHSFCTFRLVVHQPDDVHTSTFHQTGNHSWSCRTSILEGATFHKMSYCKFLWGNPCKAIETFYHWDSFLWDFGFSTHFSHSAAWKNSETNSVVSFLHAY